MTLFRTFLLCFLVHFTYQQYSGTLQIVSDLTPQECFKDGLNYFDETNSGLGLPKCDKYTSKTGKCAIYYKGTYTEVVYKPTECTKDGAFGAKQCKGEFTTGRCFCFDADGERIFGQQWQSQADNMTCACSRKKADMDDPSVYFNSLHCNSMGNYEALQCDVISEQCWCAEEKTGDLTSPVVPQKAMSKLPCYNSANVGSQYLRRCESKKYAQNRILYELKLHGTVASYVDFLCDDDGSYGAYTIVDGAAFCTWRDNSKLGSWQSGDGGEGVNCNCARDSKVFSDAGKTQSLKCEADGNYKVFQKTGSKGYCVDLDGYRKSPSKVNVSDETQCPQYRAYH